MFNRVNMNRCLSVVIFLIAMNQCNAQDAAMTSKNQVKVNVIALTAFSTSSLHYERKVKDNMTLTLGVGRKFSGSLPSILKSQESNLQLNSSGLSGLFLTGEARWYFNRYSESKAFEGFFIGPYFKYNRFSTDFDLSFDDGVIMENNSGNAKLQEYGFGFIVGYQMHVWKRITLDFIFLGPRTSRYALNIEFEETLSDEFVDAVTERINNKLDQILMKGNIDPEVTLDEIRSSFSWFGFKYGVSVGYSF